jgi:NAD(P)-dependent dehydrogenase (short-subunit alcohol dehydrogenase family)
MDNMDTLKGRTALVTGAAKRIGRAVATELAKSGVNVIVHYRSSTDEAEALVQEIRSLGVEAWKVWADFATPGEAERLMEDCFNLAGGVDILINSASIFPPGRLGEITIDDVNRNVLVNAWAPFVLSRSFADRAGEGGGGSIINLLDTRVRGFDHLHAAYHLSKHLLALLTRLTALEFAPQVTVNAVAPGLILAPRDTDYDDEYLEKLSEGLPLKKRGTPADVAGAVVFFLKSSFITGQVLYVDGGRHLREGDYG